MTRNKCITKGFESPENVRRLNICFVVSVSTVGKKILASWRILSQWNGFNPDSRSNTLASTKVLIGAVSRCFQSLCQCLGPHKSWTRKAPVLQRLHAGCSKPLLTSRSWNSWASLLWAEYVACMSKIFQKGTCFVQVEVLYPKKITIKTLA